jgi:hypothetical protein
MDRLDAGSRRASTANRVTRSRSSSWYFFGAGIAGAATRTFTEGDDTHEAPTGDPPSTQAG